MLTGAHAGVELVVVCQSMSIWAASRQHLVRDLGLLFRASVILTFCDKNWHVELRDEGFVHGDVAEAGEPVEWGEGVEGP